MQNAKTERPKQKNFCSIQVWVNTPETNKDKQENNNDNLNYVCLQAWVSRTSNNNWQPTLRVNCGYLDPIIHKFTHPDKATSLQWLHTLLCQQVEDCEELAGMIGLAGTSKGPYTVVMRIRKGVNGQPELNQATFYDRTKMLQHILSTFRNLPHITPELRGDMPQPQDEMVDVPITFEPEASNSETPLEVAA